jgi:general secretion pathway protein K
VRRRDRSRERGIALLLVVWVFMILGVIALDFARYMRDDAMATVNAAEEARGYYMALAGMNRAIFEIERAREGGGEATERTADEDENENDTLGVAEEGDLTSLVDGQWREKSFGGGRYGVRVIDECGRIPLRRVSKTLLKLVLTNILRGGTAAQGVDRRTQGAIDGVTDAILDWVDRDDLRRTHGAESDYYLGLRTPYRAKDGFLDSLDELLFVRGITANLFYGHEGSPGLRDVFSVFCPHIGVNVRTAPPAVLQALLAPDPAELADLVAQRSENQQAFFDAVLARLGASCPPDPRLCVRDNALPFMVMIEGRADLDQPRNRSHVAAVISFDDAADGARVVRWLDRAPWEGGLPGDDVPAGDDA